MAHNPKQKELFNKLSDLLIVSNQRSRATMEKLIKEALDEAKEGYVTLSDYMVANHPSLVGNPHDYKEIIKKAIEVMNVKIDQQYNAYYNDEKDHQEPVKKVHQEQVYGRLMRICLDSYQCDKATTLNFDEWMEVRGLIKKDGFFIPVENYIPAEQN